MRGNGDRGGFARPSAVAFCARSPSPLAIAQSTLIALDLPTAAAFASAQDAKTLSPKA
jgi:hypothetical protein